MHNLLTFGLPKRWADEAKEALYFYPDVLDYHYDLTMYRAEWKKLSQEQGGYLIVENGQLNRVGWLRFAWESVKGWFGFLGFNNHCHPAKIKMAAQKLLYYGYLNEFNQESPLEVMEGWDDACRPDQGYITNSKENRSDQISHLLQQQLVAFYQDNARALQALNTFTDYLPLPHKDHDYIFGNTYAVAGDIISLVHLDVQNEPFIRRIISKLQTGESTLPGSACRRIYINHIFATIREQFEEILRVRSTSSGFMSSVSRLFSTQRDDCLVLEGLHCKAETTRVLWPELIKNHTDILIKLKLEWAHQLKEGHDKLKRKELYNDAYKIIEGLPDKARVNEYLLRYFYDDDSFATLPIHFEVVQAWGEHLFSVVLQTCNTLDTQTRCSYRIAQIRPDIIPLPSLTAFIERCLRVQDYHLTVELIERLSENNMPRAVKFLKDYRQKLYPHMKPNTPLSKAYARELVNDAQNTSTLMSFFSNSTKTNYDIAALLDSTIANHEAAAYFFEKYVHDKQWDMALQLIEVRKQQKLAIDELPIAARKILAHHYWVEGERLWEQGSAIRDDNFSEAEIDYRQSLRMKETAAFVLDSDNNLHAVNVHLRLLAQCMVDGDEAHHGLSLPRLDEALGYLARIDNTICTQKDEDLGAVYIRTLEHKVHLLHERCLGANRGDYSVQPAHRERCRQFIAPLIESIDKLIALRAGAFGVGQVDNNYRLSYLHFLKAEIISFFKLNEDDRDHYRKATELEPNQAYYYSRYSVSLSLSNRELSHEMLAKGQQLLAKCPALQDGMSAQEAHLRWLEERWLKQEDKIYNIDMPAPVAKEQNTFFSRFGFS